MSNQVLYRKYRPQLFADVVGQEHLKKTLLNALKEDKVAHAYLFCGPRGCGKTTMARILAKAVNCEDKSTQEPCNKCSSCLDITSGRDVDIIEIDAASHRGIDEVRELREGARFAPAKGKYKVFILDEAHQLTSGADNALLKILEEAPEHVIFILATTEADKMMATVISRCQRFDFRKILVDEIVDKLKKIAKEEKVVVEDGVLKIIAAHSGGALRDAESLLSQMFSFTPKGEEIKKEDVKSLLGFVERELVVSFVGAVTSKEAVKALAIIEELSQKGVAIDVFYKGILQYLRDLMVTKILFTDKKTEESNSVKEEMMSRLTEEEIEELRERAGVISIISIKDLIDVFHLAGDRIKYTPFPQLPLEVAVAEITAKLAEKE